MNHSFYTHNPFTEKDITSYSYQDDDMITQCVDRAHDQFHQWKNIPLEKRLFFISKLATALEQNKQICSEMISNEMGKPIHESLSEVTKCKKLCEDYIKQSQNWLSDKIVKNTNTQNFMIRFEPLGVILSIMPWNFPFWQVFRFAVPTLIAGNTTLLKHAENVTGCAFLIEKLFKDAGFPEDCFQVILASHTTLAQTIAHPKICGVSFTGSTHGGQSVAKTCGTNLKKFVMELGGSDPFIVLNDANLYLAIEGAIKSRFINAGQSCIAAKRFIISNDIIHEFIDLFLERIKQIRTGNPLDPSTNMGPLVHRQALTRLDKQLKTALEQGARLIYGGQSSPEGKGCFFQPTLLTDVKPHMIVFNEEIFGPIASITGFSQDHEAITLANQTEFGLGASVWSKDSSRALVIGNQLECGSVAINDFVKSDPLLPFGGVKKSGIGRELAQYGLHEFVNIKSYTLTK